MGREMEAGLLRCFGGSPDLGLERSIWAVGSAGSMGEGHTPHFRLEREACARFPVHASYLPGKLGGDNGGWEQGCLESAPWGSLLPEGRSA